ncbi:hypothetical protein [Candidatus Methylopumilus universalis]|jgi:hypothetical protein|uniref:hypothetical protein n=1 Tax=Candidatus Methylopumilus universalis TaxID=2588536 RepID=UPI00111D2683|nr:hypothetical protein [Candidatus Methylopumilus universalis]QDC79074.1 hypothetical protein FIT84_04120 [Candidatus Methylopumilus universalis]
MTTDSHKYYISQLLAKTFSFAQNYLFVILLHKFSNSSELRDWSLITQWISICAILDLGLINFINTARNPLTSSRILGRLSFPISIFFAFTWTVYLYFQANFDFKLIFILFFYVFFSYFIFMKAFFFSKSSDYIGSIYAYFVTSLGSIIFFILTLLGFINFNIKTILIFDTFIKASYFFLGGNWRYGNYSIWQFSKKIIHIFPYARLQLYMFLVHSSEYILAYNMIKSVEEYNEFSSSFRAAQMSLLVVSLRSSRVIQKSKMYRNTYENISNILTLLFLTIASYCVLVFFKGSFDLTYILFVLSESLVVLYTTFWIISDRAGLEKFYFLTFLPITALKAFLFYFYKADFLFGPSVVFLLAIYIFKPRKVLI